MISYPCDDDANPKPLIDRLIAHEGVKKFAYQDTKGYLTVGIGRCIDSRVGKGLSIDECMYLLRNDIKDFRLQLETFDWFNLQDCVRQDVLVELAFNMGISNLLKFKKMIADLLKKDYQAACMNLIDSAWHNQVSKDRSRDICYRLEHGNYQS